MGLTPRSMATGHAQCHHEFITAFPGVNISGRYFGLPAASIGAEVGLPLYQDLNGLHTKRIYTAQVGLKYAF